jgi:hypothetical protein
VWHQLGEVGSGSADAWGGRGSTVGNSAGCVPRKGRARAALSVLAWVEKRRKKDGTWRGPSVLAGCVAWTTQRGAGGGPDMGGSSPGTMAPGHTRGRQGKREKGERAGAPMSGPVLKGGAQLQREKKGERVAGGA